MIEQFAGYRVIQHINKELQNPSLGGYDRLVLTRARSQCEEWVISKIKSEYPQESSPSSCQNFWQEITTLWLDRVGLKTQVPSCPGTKADLKQLQKRGGVRLYVPPALADDKGRELLFKIFPYMASNFGSLFPKEKRIHNIYQQSGWIDSFIKPIYDYTPSSDVESIKQQIVLKGTQGATLNTEIIHRALFRDILGEKSQPLRMRLILGTTTPHPVVFTQTPEYSSLLEYIAFADLRIGGFQYLDVHEIQLLNLSVRPGQSVH